MERNRGRHGSGVVFLTPIIALHPKESLLATARNRPNENRVLSSPTQFRPLQQLQNNVKILLTGATGFVGGNLLPRLLADG
jgi:hypothetical protein